jgi:pimeloyl-ACP methyl ester carboxylesterase
MVSKRKPSIAEKTWNFEECTGGIAIREANRIIPKLTPVFLNNDPDKADNKDGFLQQFYFIRLPSNEESADKTVLFVGGGPGSIALPDDDEETFWLSSLPDEGTGFNVVYFHLRGSGYSQIPFSNEFDRFLRTKFAVEDIEIIRKDLFPNEPEKKWDAVVGHSYGTVLAQQYTAKYPQFVDKLILIGAISLHEFTTPGNETKAYNDYINAVQDIRRETIDKLFTVRAFKTIRGKDAIKSRLFGKRSAPGLFRILEENFISDQFVIDNFDKPKVKKELARCGLGRVSVELFKALRELRKLGWSPIKIQSDERDNLVKAGKRIFSELSKATKGLRLAANRAAKKPARQSKRYSLRVLYAMGIYDGLNRKFLTKWLASDKRNFREILRSFPGQAHTNMGKWESIEKIGETPDDITSIQAWDPANHKHDRPTLILNGGADLVTAGSQARRYYDEALNGPRIFVDIDGAGHDFLLPDITVPVDRFEGICKGRNVNPRDCLIAAFILLPVTEFLSKAKTIFEKLEDKGLSVAD